MNALAVLLAATSLHVSVGAKAYTLRCDPPQGTLPHAASACTKLLRLRRPFAPVPAGIACSQIYGGPQTAVVTGRFRGASIHTRFRRTDSCEIARWNRVRFLFPVATPLP